MKNCIYAFKNKTEIIYIGKSSRLNSRIKSHSHLPNECYKELETIEYISLKTKDDTDLAERYLIAKYKPKYNEVYKNKNITFKIPYLDNKKWIILEESKLYNIGNTAKYEEYKPRKKDNELPRQDLFLKWLHDSRNSRAIH